MKTKKKDNNKKRISKKSIILLVICLFIFVAVILYAVSTDSEVPIISSFKYKSELVIEAGSKVPTMNDYLYKNEEKEKEIVWANIDIEDGKVYKTGTYEGKFNYDKKVISNINDKYIGRTN